MTFAHSYPFLLETMDLGKKIPLNLVSGCQVGQNKRKCTIATAVRLSLTALTNIRYDIRNIPFIDYCLGYESKKFGQYPTLS